MSTAAEPALVNLAELLAALAGRVDVLADKVHDLEQTVWRLERQDRNQRRERR
jgi:hypothetical protein